MKTLLLASLVGLVLVFGGCSSSSGGSSSNTTAVEEINTTVVEETNTTVVGETNTTVVGEINTTVIIINSVPVVSDTNISVSVMEYATVSLSLLANVSDSDVNDTLQVVSVSQLDGNTTLPNGYSYNDENLTIDATSINVADGVNLVYDLNITISDDEDNVSYIVNSMIQDSTNDALLITSDIVAPSEVINGNDLNISLTASDTDGMISVSYNLYSSTDVNYTSSLDNGDLSDNLSDGNYSTTVSSASLADGNYTVVVDVVGNVIGENPLSTATKLHSFSVVPLDTAPVANTDSYTTAFETTVNGNVVSNDVDDEGDVISVISNTSPVNGSLSIDVNGSFEYIPDVGFSGADSFEYTINGGDVSTVTITVEAEPFMPDTLPNPYDFTNIVDAPLNSTVQTNTITVTGINTSVTATTDLGTLVVNGVDTLTTAASVEEGDLVAVSVETGGVYSAVFSGEVVIGGGSDGFSVGVEAEPVLTPTISLDDQTVDDNGGFFATDLPAPTVTNVNVGAVYSIENDPTGGMLTIDATTGIATWLGDLSITTNYDITIKVLNTDGTTSSTTFVLSVKNNG